MSRSRRCSGRSSAGSAPLFGPIVGGILLHGLGDVAKRAMGDAPGLNLVLYGVRC